MLRVDGNYLYTVGYQIHPISEFRHTQAGRAGTTYNDAWFPLLVAEGALEPLLSRSVFKLKTSVQAGHSLLATIRSIRSKGDEAIKSQTADTQLDPMDVYYIQENLKTFENILAAELALLPLYVVTQKAGFDTAILVDMGASCFPDDLAAKAPEAIYDLSQATKCIAFEVPTAAGFHLHRANEAVLRRYWDAVSGGEKRPSSRNMGEYLTAMDTKKIGNELVKAALRHVKDFHRNPLIHPEHIIETVDEAIALMNSIHTVMVQMLKEMPEVSPMPAPLPQGSIVPATSNLAVSPSE